MLCVTTAKYAGELNTPVVFVTVVQFPSCQKAIMISMKFYTHKEISPSDYTFMHAGRLI